MEAMGWIVNILALIGWIVNIKYRKQAMMIFAVATFLSIIYFWFVWQPSFFYKSLIYAVIDIATLANIFGKENKWTKHTSKS